MHWKGTAAMEFKVSPVLKHLESAIPDRNLLAEANHRVANSLALLGGLVRMQGRGVGKADKPPSKAELRMMFDGIAARIATIGQLHRMLAHDAGRRRHRAGAAYSGSLHCAGHGFFVRRTARPYRASAAANAWS